MKFFDVFNEAAMSPINRDTTRKQLNYLKSSTGNALEHIKNPTPEIQRIVINNYPTHLYNLQKISEENLEFFQEHKSTIIEHLLATAQNEKKYVDQYAVSTLNNCGNIWNFVHQLTLIGCIWSELEEVKNIIKPMIVKTLLIGVRDSEPPYYHIKLSIKYLRQRGANWPELDVIQNSLDAGRARPSLNENERTRVDLPDGGWVDKHKHDNGQSEFYYNKYGEIHRDDDLPAANDLIHGSREWFKNGKLHRDSGPAIEYNHGGTSWFTNGNRHRITGPAVDWLHTKKWFINGQDISDLMKFYMKKYLIILPIEPSKPIVAELDRDKNTILKQILTNIKDKRRSDIYLPLIHMFKTLGVTWPELDAIQKSGEASLQQLTEATKKSNEIRVKSVKNYLALGYIETALRHIEFFKGHDLLTQDEIDQILLKYKPQIMKYLLGLMPTLDFYMLKKQLYLLRLFGQNWEEFKIIEKSINYEVNRKIAKLTENTIGNSNTSPKVKAAIDKLIEELSENNRLHYRAYAILDWLESRYTNDVKIANLAQALSTPEVMNIILDWVNGVITKNFFVSDILMNTLDRLAGIGVKWNLTTNNAFETHKKLIIRGFLQRIKDESSKDFPFIVREIQSLRQLGLDWPELTTIERSLTATEKVTESKFTDQYSDNPKMQKKLRELLIALSSQSHHYVLLDWMGRLLDLDLKNNRVAVKMLSDPVIMGYILKWIKKQLATSAPVEIIVHTLTRMVALGVRWNLPPKNVFEQYKKAIVRYFLVSIADATDSYYKHIIKEIQAMKTLGLNWQEFDIMLRSLTANEKVTESVDINEIDYVNDKFNMGRIAVAIELLNRYAQVGDISQKTANQILVKYKSQIVKYLLKLMRICDFWRVKIIIDRCKEFGINWQEFDIIQHSIDHEQEKLKESKFLTDNRFDRSKIKIITRSALAQTLAIVQRHRRLEEKQSILHENTTSGDQSLQSNGARAISHFENDNIYDGVLRTFKDVDCHQITIHTAEFILDEYKTPIIRYLISLFADDLDLSFKWCGDTITRLETLGITWPELKIIKRSLEHEIQRRQ